MCGLTLYSSEQNPIMILSGDKVTLTEKKRPKQCLAAFPRLRFTSAQTMQASRQSSLAHLRQKMILQKIYQTKFTKIKKYLKCIEKRKVLC